MTNEVIEKLFNSDFMENYQTFDKNFAYAEAYEEFQELQKNAANNPELSGYIQLAEKLIDQTALHYFKAGVRVGLDLGE